VFEDAALQGGSADGGMSPIGRSNLSVGTNAWNRITLCHELGHTFGLAHALDHSGSIMYSWWDFPFTSLFGNPGNDEKSILRGSLFFATQACNKNVQVNQVSMPATVRARTQFNTSFNVTNYGFCHWNANVTDIHIKTSNVWGLTVQQLGQDIYPAQPYIFSLNLTAPRISVASKVYDNYWRMRISGTYFGPQMGGTITVTR
jgi:hypothetical protein